MWLCTGAQLYRAPNLSTHPSKDGPLMSEITAAPDALADEPPAPVRHLRGNLGVAVHRIHGGRRRRAARRDRRRRPARYRRGQRRRIPGDLHRLHGDPAVLRGRFHRADAVCRRGGRVLLVCPYSRWAFPTGIGIAFVALVSYVAIEAGVYGLLGPAGVASSSCSAARPCPGGCSRRWPSRSRRSSATATSSCPAGCWPCC